MISLKRILYRSAVLTLLVVLLAGIAVSASAAETEPCTLTVGSVTGQPGETVTVPVTISNNTGFAGFKFVVKYDETAMNLIEVKQGVVLNAVDKVGLSTSADKTQLIWATATNTMGDGVLFELTFTINSAANNGDYPVEIETEDFCKLDNSLESAPFAEILSVCNMGFVRVETGMDVVDRFNFSGARVVMGNNLDMQFAFAKSAVSDWTGHYVKVTRSYADGNADQVTTIPVSEWTDSGSVYMVTYAGLAAKEMADEITLVICNAEGQEVSNPWVDSMRNYAMRNLDKSAQNLKVLFVDMLNYGAAAQSYFNYGTNDLANSQLTDAQKALASEAKPVTNYQSGGPMARLILESNINFQLAFSGTPAGAYAKVSFTNHQGNKIEETIAADDLLTVSGMKSIILTKLVVADARQLVTVTFYNADGTVFKTYEESIESYVARNSSTQLLLDFMKFADSAHAYLHP